MSPLLIDPMEEDVEMTGEVVAQPEQTDTEPQGDRTGSIAPLPDSGVTVTLMCLRWFLPKKTITLSYIPLLYGSIIETVNAIHIPVHRIGEAKHPGPQFWLGTTNPSGLKDKLETYHELPSGLWGVSETHATLLNQRDNILKLRRLNHFYQRHLQILHGAPVTPRTATSSTGTWSGVAAISDLICRNVGIHWPNSEFSLGRVQLLQAWYGPFTLTGANCYGWPHSPTWPKAAEATEEMLIHLTTELVLSRTGPRFIMGDFNCQDQDSPSIAVWKTQGWVEIQTWAFERHEQAPTPTSKHVNFLDLEEVWSYRQRQVKIFFHFCFHCCFRFFHFFFISIFCFHFCFHFFRFFFFISIFLFSFLFSFFFRFFHFFSFPFFVFIFFIFFVFFSFFSFVFHFFSFFFICLGFCWFRPNEVCQ